MNDDTKEILKSTGIGLSLFTIIGIIVAICLLNKIAAYIIGTVLLLILLLAASYIIGAVIRVGYEDLKEDREKERKLREIYG